MLHSAHIPFHSFYSSDYCPYTFNIPLSFVLHGCTHPVACCDLQVHPKDVFVAPLLHVFYQSELTVVLHRICGQAASASKDGAALRRTVSPFLLAT